MFILRLPSFWGYLHFWGCHHFGGLLRLYFKNSIKAHNYRVSLKKGISECRCVCSTAQLMWSLEFSFPIHLKIEIHVFVTSTEPFLSDFRERRKWFFKYPIWHILLASCESSSSRVIHRLIVHSQQRDRRQILSP